ncbi:hypothetical protein EOL73_04110 [Candidatus Saccharibacteria bacterium]|nr:hypothetical protein [Candidatus Saccharibacteria bacterium]NCU40912.1 hypothetical protein [Candidatus Saccharibacteria bacterium]
MTQISRRQLASYAAESLVAGRIEVIDQLAAYLVSERRVKEADSLVRDIEKALLSYNTLVAHVSSARGLDPAQRSEIETLLKERYNAKQVAIDVQTDEDLLGGVVIRTASDEFDSSLRRNINRLKAIKV